MTHPLQYFHAVHFLSFTQMTDDMMQTNERELIQAKGE
jgi:hypothetical protein